MRRVAALVRTHRPEGRKALDLAERLVEAGFRDVIIAADETQAPVEAGGFPKRSHTLRSLADLGLHMPNPGPKTLWFCGDYAYYGSVLGQATHDFYLMVEYDVGLRDPGADWFRRLRLALEDPALADLDMLGASLGPYRATHFRSDFADPWKSFFAITGLSARAVEALYRARLREKTEGAADPRGTHCEVFLPSVLRQAGGFRLEALNTILPGAVSRDAFGTLTILPLGHEDLAEGDCGLLHRIVDMDEYLQKAPFVMARARRVPVFVRHLAALQDRGLSEAEVTGAMSRAYAEGARLAKAAARRPGTASRA